MRRNKSLSALGNKWSGGEFGERKGSYLLYVRDGGFQMKAENLEPLIL